jgi:hypothetical protein
MSLMRPVQEVSRIDVQLYYYFDPKRITTQMESSSRFGRECLGEFAHLYGGGGVSPELKKSSFSH